jgi:mono/diheme cytochrome c family protein
VRKAAFNGLVAAAFCYAAAVISFCADAGEAGKGRRLFGTICSHCHGPNMVNPGNGSFDLRTFPHDGKERFVTSLTKGKGNMPPFEGKLNSDEIDDLWAYIRTGGKL